MTDNNPETIPANTGMRAGGGADSCRIVCVCCGYGFPNGMAQTARIRMVGRALASAGCRFDVLNIGGGFYPNSASKGTVDGILFEHLPGPTRRFGNPIARALTHTLGALQTAARLSAFRREKQTLRVYSWFPGGRNAWFHRYLHSQGYAIAQEVNEWWPAAGKVSPRDLNVRLTSGSLAISLPIIERLKALPSYSAGHSILHLPILVDYDRWSLADHHRANQVDQPYVLWCGNLASATEDITFLLSALALVNKTMQCRLVLVGGHNDKVRRSICNLALAAGLKSDALRFTGFTADAELRGLMHKASALLLPLWESERSACRFPTKLGEYLCSSSPVVTSGVGDLTRYLEDGVSACFAPLAKAGEFAKRILFLLQDGARARAIGKAGCEIARRHFNWEIYKNQLFDFFVSLKHPHDQPRA